MNEDEEFTIEETQLGIKIFTTLWFLVIFLNFVAIGLAIYAGIKGWTWYIFLPVWAALWFGLRVLKRYLRNIVEELTNDILCTEGIAENDNDKTLDKNTQQFLNSPKFYGLISIAMLLVAGLWYGIGVLIGKLF